MKRAELRVGVPLAMAAALAGGPGPAHADRDPWYLTAAAGYSDVGISSGFWLDSDRATGSTDTGGLALQAGAGYRFSRHLAAETSFLMAGETTFRGQTDGFNSRWNAGEMKGRTKVQGVAIQAVGFWPLRGARISLYAQGGLFFWDTTTYYDSTINDINRFNDDGLSPIGGLGAEMRLGQKWGVRGGWQYTAAHFEKRVSVGIHMGTIGLVRILD